MKGQLELVYMFLFPTAKRNMLLKFVCRSWELV